MKSLRSFALAWCLLNLVATAAWAASAQDLYDDTQVRVYRLTFNQPNFLMQLYQSQSTEIYVEADLEVDGIVYPSVGVRFRGNSTYTCTSNDKRPMKIKMDAFVPGQELYGYDIFRLNNGAGDPSFLREALMSKLLQPYLPVAKRAYARIEVNGLNFGLYINEQEKDSTYMGEWFEADWGNRYRASWPAVFQNLGSLVQWIASYELENPGNPNAHIDLQDLGNLVNNTPIGPGLTAAINDTYDVDVSLWNFAACQVFGNWDSYLGNGNNWGMLHDEHHGRLQMQIHDLDLSFGTWSFGAGWGLNSSINSGITNITHPLAGRVLADLDLRLEYYAHVRTLVEEVFDWSNVVGPLAQRYHDMIDPEVFADPLKHYSYNAFVTGLTSNQNTSGQCWSTFPGIQAWVQQRRAALLAMPQLSAPTVTLDQLEHRPPSPRLGDPVKITVRVLPGTQPSLVELRWRTLGGYRRVAMADDGMSGDGAANDGIYGSVLPPLPPGARIEYLVLARAANTQQAVTFLPRRAESAPRTFEVGFDPVGVRISEYLYAGNGAEFVELTNTSSQPVDLSGWSLDDETAEAGAFDLSLLGSVAAGDSVIVTETSALAFATDWNLSGVLVVGGSLAAGLGRNDAIHLFDGGGNLVDRLAFGDEAFPGSVRAKDTSASVCYQGLAQDDPFAWSLAALGDGQGSWSSTSGDLGSPGVWMQQGCVPGGLGAVYCESTPNSTGSAAELSGHGSLLLDHSALVLYARNVPAGQFGYFVMADSQDMVPGFGGSQGVLCLGLPLVRFAEDLLVGYADETLIFAPDLNDLPQGTLIAPGETWNFQLWFRDVNPGQTSNTSGGLALTFH